MKPSVMLPAPTPSGRAGTVSSLRRRGRALGTSGMTTVELAMLGPVFVAMVLMLFEVGLQAAVAGALDFGARRAGRLGITGATTANGAVASNSAREAALHEAVLLASGGLLNEQRLTLSQSSYESIAGARAGTSAASGPGAAGQVVRYDLTYVQPLLTGELAAALLSRTSFTHSTTILVINEPFPKL